ncbi:DNA topoisomerase [Lysinibacillus sphaericus]|uniref:DNA topoisomerase n=1 Tax=Lysinibacillus sphaericus TaxID=1421 RepID=UPI0034408F89
MTNHVTTPLKEKTLLRVMETCGKGIVNEDRNEIMEAILSGYSIGTPATWAETIKKLITVGYLAMENKNLVCTELGRNFSCKRFI